MQNILKPTALLVLFMIAGSHAQAFTADELFATAMSNGVAKGALTGAVADRLRQDTHSTEPTQVILVRGETTPDGCQFFRLTITQPNIPKRDGGFAGDYTTVTKVATCKDDRQPIPPEILGCSIGGVSCMPPGKR